MSPETIRQLADLLHGQTGQLACLDLGISDSLVAELVAAGARPATHVYQDGTATDHASLWTRSIEVYAASRRRSATPDEIAAYERECDGRDSCTIVTAPAPRLPPHLRGLVRP